MVRAERAYFLVCIPFVTFWGTLIENEVNKNLSNKFVWGKKAVWEQLPPSCQAATPDFRLQKVLISPNFTCGREHGQY